MLIAVLAFLAMGGAILGGWVVATYLPGFVEGRKLERRLRDVSLPTAAEDEGGGDSTIVKQRVQGPLPVIDRIVSRSAAGTSLARLIEKSGVKTTPGAVVTISIAVGALAAILASMFIRAPFAPFAIGLIGLALPTLWLTHRKTARFKRFEEQFPEALDLLSRAIRAGHAFQTAMGMVADELPEPVGPEFKKTFDQQNFGLPLRDALNDLSVRINILDVRFFVTAVLIQRDTGGNLAEILDNLAHVVRERFKIQRQVRVHTAHGRFTGYVLLGLPAALAVALSFINPEHMHLLFSEHMGQQMLMGAVVMQTIGFFWIRKVIKIEV